jgi:hypothetical protein
VREVEVTQMVDPRVDLKIVHRHPVLLHWHPHASVADQHVQPAIIKVSTRDIQRLPKTLFPSVLRMEYFDCPERLLHSTLHVIKREDRGDCPLVLSRLFQGGFTVV